MADLSPRKVPADTEIGYTTIAGDQRTLRSKPLEGDDEYHFIEPRDEGDVAVLDGFGFPVARKAEDDAPAADEATGKSRKTR